MSTTSPNFNLVLATTSDVVSVTSHISNNFSTLDSLLSQAHTGSGQLKAGLQIVTPTIASPTLSGSAVGATFVSAGTGSFNTITATGGAVTVNSFSIGTYGLPLTIGSTSTILTVVTGNAVWAAASPNTGANQALSNLASVAINTNMNTFTAGFVTVARVIATSGALTGLTAFQASAGTFIGNVIISGTATINAVNCTGGSITAGGVTIGTFALPSTIAGTGVMRSLSNTATWYAPMAPVNFSFRTATASSGSLVATTANRLAFITAIHDPGTNATTGLFTAPASGVYRIDACVVVNVGTSATREASFGIMIAGTQHDFTSMVTTATGSGFMTAAITRTMAQNDTAYAVVTVTGSASGMTVSPNGYFLGQRIFEF